MTQDTAVSEAQGLFAKYADREGGADGKLLMHTMRLIRTIENDVDPDPDLLMVTDVIVLAIMAIFCHRRRVKELNALCLLWTEFRFGENAVPRETSSTRTECEGDIIRMVRDMMVSLASER